MRFRRPRCAGNPLTYSDAAGTAWSAHPPHSFTEYEIGSSATGFVVECPGWSEDDAAASAVVAALRKHCREEGARLDIGWKVSRLLLRLTEPDLADMIREGGLNERIDRIFGVEVRIAAGDPEAWLIAAPGGTLAEGRVPVRG